MLPLLFSLLLPTPPSNGTIVHREAYTFPFDSHAKWLNHMNGKGLKDWSILFAKEDFDRYNTGDEVVCERIRYLSDGLEISGFMLTPQKGEGPFPAVIYNRGGTAQWGRITFWEILEMYRLAERGHVVVASYLRGVGGSQGKPQLGGGDIRDTLALLPLLENTPRADAKRIGMWGFSRGGTTTLTTLTKTDRIAAAVIIAGVSDAMGNSRRQEFETHVYPGVLVGFEQDPDKAMRAVSPKYWVEKLPAKTPLLFLHGTADDRVAPGHTLDLAKRLQDLGRTYRLKIYEHGSHSLVEHFQSVRREIDHWLDTWLAAAPPIDKPL